jgi:RNA 2',3'-cyclic 3'-phosphodiesterase
VTSPGTVGGHERLRLFCALRLPDEVLDRLEPWQREHLSGGRQVRREQLHLTLAFLGARPADDLPAVRGALHAAARDSGEIVFSAVRYRETRSVGMLVLDDETGEAGRLALRLFEGLEGAGMYRREKRPWLPHVTVLRFRERPRLDPPVPGLGRFSPSDAAVYMSVLRPSGAQYDVLDTVALGG